MEAIRYLTARKGKTTSAELEEIYNSTQDVEVRRAVLDALVSAGDKAALIRFAGAGSNSPVEVRQRAIQGLGNASLITAPELMQLYQKEENKDLRQAMVRALGSMGAVDQITQIIKSEKEPSVRQQAIRSLGNMKTERTGQALTELYGADQDKDVRKAVISALGKNNVDGPVSIARKERTRAQARNRPPHRVTRRRTTRHGLLMEQISDSLHRPLRWGSAKQAPPIQKAASRRGRPRSNANSGGSPDRSIRSGRAGGCHGRRPAWRLFHLFERFVYVRGEFLENGPSPAAIRRAMAPPPALSSSRPPAIWSSWSAWPRDEWSG